MTDNVEQLPMEVKEYIEGLRLCLGNLDGDGLIPDDWINDLSKLFTQEISKAEQRGAERERKRIKDLVNRIKNGTSDEAPLPWFDALYCVRDSI